MAERWTDPVSYGPDRDDRPETFEQHVEVKPRQDMVRALAAFGAIVLVLWFVASLALWAFGQPWQILISGVAGLFVAAVLGLGLSLGSE